VHADLSAAIEPRSEPATIATASATDPAAPLLEWRLATLADDDEPGVGCVDTLSVPDFEQIRC
jgi:hypothetical protein